MPATAGAAGSGRLRQSPDPGHNNGGTSWNPQSLPAGTNSLNAISFSDTSHGCAWGWDGTTLRTTDGGSHWSTDGGAVDNGYLTSVAFADADKGWGSRRQRHDTRHDRRRHQVEGAILGAQRLPLRSQLRRCQPRLGGGMAEPDQSRCHPRHQRRRHQLEPTDTADGHRPAGVRGLRRCQSRLGGRWQRHHPGHHRRWRHLGGPVL